MTDKIKPGVEEQHIINFLMNAANRNDMANLDAKIDRNAERFEQQILSIHEKMATREDIRKLEDKVDSNFKWTMGLLIPIIIGGFAGVFYKMMDNQPNLHTTAPVATVQQK